MLTFLKKITHTISTHNLIKRGDTVVLGVSGGADSMALLEVFDKIRHAWGLQVIVCHVNHGLRKSADADERFVKKICDQRGIPCHCVRITMPAKPKDSIEQLAREKRFAALIKTAKKLNADAVALAHHQNDLAETVLMRIIRGSGLQGLQAILPKRRINGTLFIRPLIHQTREDIEKFLTQEGVSYRNDPTNSDLKFFRNKIRHQLMNCLRTKYNPKIQEALAGLAETASIDYGFLQQEAEKNFETVINSLKNIPCLSGP